jgi:hypothetical protein
MTENMDEIINDYNDFQVITIPPHGTSVMRNLMKKDFVLTKEIEEFVKIHFSNVFGEKYSHPQHVKSQNYLQSIYTFIQIENLSEKEIVVNIQY